MIPEAKVVCVLRDWCSGETRLTWTCLDHLRDYDNPMSPGALIKAVLLYCRLVDPQSSDSLASQLRNKYRKYTTLVWHICVHQPNFGHSEYVCALLDLVRGKFELQSDG